MSVEILTPVGRLVQGDCFEGSDRDHLGNPRLVKTGPNTGQARMEYFIAIAIPKTDPGYADVWGKIYNEARRGFANFFDPASGACKLPTFAFKVTDGDSQVPNTNGTAPCSREGFPGNWILNMSGGFAPKCYVAVNGEYKQILDPKAIKRGDYIRVAGSVVSNDNPQKPGVYLNLHMIQFVGHGVEIVTGPRAADVFGASPVVMPAGASATPLAPAMPMPGMVAPAPAFAPPPPVPVGTPPPAHDFLKAAPPAPAAYTPPAPAAYVPPAPVADTRRTPDGGTYTREQLTAAGYPAAAIDALPRA